MGLSVNKCGHNAARNHVNSRPSSVIYLLYDVCRNDTDLVETNTTVETVLTDAR